MFDKKSVYALNKKDPNAIVYPDAHGSLIRLTRNDFTSEEEFKYWKDWSDANLHTEEKGDHVEFNHTLSLDGLSEEAIAVPAVDVILEKKQMRCELSQMNAEQIAQLRQILSKIQFRRLWLKEAQGKTLEEIAHLEAVSVTAVFYSIQAAHKKISVKFA